MKKIIFTLAFVALLAAGCNYQTANQNNSNNTSNTNTSEQMQTYHNSSYGIEFQYPVSMQFVTPQFGSLENKIVELEIPQTDYPKTNFAGASFSVSAAPAPSIDKCLAMNAPQNSGGFKTKQTINGLVFYSTKAGGAAAGNLYDQMVYRTLSSKYGCVELIETIHTGNIGNYPEGTVTEVDKQPIQAKLDSALNSFRIIQ